MLLELLHGLTAFIVYLFPIGIISQILKPVLVVGQPYKENFGLWEILSLVLFGIMITAILNKDVVNGQSIVNRMIGYKVVDSKTLQPANELRCMIRNITMPIWPIEGLFVLVNPSRRLGDLIAGTKLIDATPTDPEMIFEEIKLKSLNSGVLLTFLVSLLIVGFYTILFDPRFGII